MILVSCPLKQNDIIKIIEEYKGEEKQVFRLENKKGSNLYFNSTLENNDEACLLIKKLIKSYKYSPALMYNVVSCEDGKINWYK